MFTLKGASMSEGDHQYAVRNGRNVDMDIEDVFDHITRQKYDDPYLDGIFWKMVEAYYRNFHNVKSNFDPLPSVKQLANDENIVDDVLTCIGAAGSIIPVEDLEHLPEDFEEQYPEVNYAAAIQMTGIDELPTDYTFGVSRAHAATLAIVQLCRETSDESLNLPEGHSLN